MEHFLGHNYLILKDKVLPYLEIELNNYVFFFQGKIYQHFQGAAVGSPLSPVFANIYMEYFEKNSTKPSMPIPTPRWKRCG